jgi:beta-galactosidase
MNNWDDISEEISFPKGLRHGTVFRVSEMIFDGLTMK